MISTAVPRRGRMSANRKRLRTSEKRHSGLASLQASGPQPNAGLIPCVMFFVIVDGVLRTLSPRTHASSPLKGRLICATRFSGRDLARGVTDLQRSPRPGESINAHVGATTVTVISE